MCSGKGKSGWPRLQRMTRAPSVFSTARMREPNPKAASVPMSFTRLAKTAVWGGMAL
jgi:hypothetical protein